METALKIFLIIIAICGLFEATILGIAFFGADRVQCIFLWCTFTTVRTEKVTHIISSEHCYLNDVPVNCSPYSFDDLATDVFWGNKTK